MTLTNKNLILKVVIKYKSERYLILKYYFYYHPYTRLSIHQSKIYYILFRDVKDYK